MTHELTPCINQNLQNAWQWLMHHSITPQNAPVSAGAATISGYNDPPLSMLHFDHNGRSCDLSGWKWPLIKVNPLHQATKNPTTLQNQLIFEMVEHIIQACVMWTQQSGDCTLSEELMDNTPFEADLKNIDSQKALVKHLSRHVLAGERFRAKEWFEDFARQRQQVTERLPEKPIKPYGVLVEAMSLLNPDLYIISTQQGVLLCESPRIRQHEIYWILRRTPLTLSEGKNHLDFKSPEEFLDFATRYSEGQEDFPKNSRPELNPSDIGLPFNEPSIHILQNFQQLQ